MTLTKMLFALMTTSLAAHAALAVTTAEHALQSSAVKSASSATASPKAQDGKRQAEPAASGPAKGREAGTPAANAASAKDKK